MGHPSFIPRLTTIIWTSGISVLSWIESCLTSSKKTHIWTVMMSPHLFFLMWFFWPCLVRLCVIYRGLVAWRPVMEASLRFGVWLTAFNEWGIMTQTADLISLGCGPVQPHQRTIRFVVVCDPLRHNRLPLIWPVGLNMNKSFYDSAIIICHL